MRLFQKFRSMATFELTAKQPIILGPGSIVPKGEKLTMNIHTLGARPANIFATPENRRQALQQFAMHGIELKPNSHYLHTGYWDIKDVTGKNSFSKDIESPGLERFDSFRKPFSEFGNPKIDDVQMKKECIGSVREFYQNELDIKYADSGLESRCEIATNFYNEVKKSMGINADISFADMPSNKLGGYDPVTNSIELNRSYLEYDDCSDLLNTILHESRHAFQAKCITSPDSVTVNKKIIDVWGYNFDHYIKPEFDHEAYENQEIEKDANYFADSVMKKGTDAYYYV